MARAHPNHRGASKLRAALTTWLAGTRTRSDLENVFLVLCRRHGLPRPRVNRNQLTDDEHGVVAILRTALAKARAA